MRSRRNGNGTSKACGFSVPGVLAGCWRSGGHRVSLPHKLGSPSQLGKLEARARGLVGWSPGALSSGDPGPGVRQAQLCGPRAGSGGRVGAPQSLGLHTAAGPRRRDGAAVGAWMAAGPPLPLPLRRPLPEQPGPSVPAAQSCVSRGRAVPSLPSRRAPRPSQGALWRQGGPGGKKGIDGVKSKTVCGPRRRGTRSATTARSLLVLTPRPRCPLPALLRVLARHPCTPELPARRRGLPTPRPAPGLRL